MSRRYLYFAVAIAVAFPAAARPPAHHRASASHARAAASHHPAAAAPADCSTFYAGGKSPAAVAPGGDSGRIFCHSFYSVGYSTSYRNPLWSAEHLTAAIAAGGDATKRLKSIRFHAEPDLKPAQQGSHDDYERPWDRGHMTPANDAENPTTQRDTFVVTNIVPQHANLNERLWQYLEASVHQLAKDDGEVYIVTGPVFDAHPRLMGGRIAIPASTFKAIYDPARNVAVAYIATNEAAPTCKVISVAEVTRATGIDPFPSLAATAKDHVPALVLPKGPAVPLPDCR